VLNDGNYKHTQNFGIEKNLLESDYSENRDEKEELMDLK
jgi:hypothetical protein